MPTNSRVALPQLSDHSWLFYELQDSLYRNMMTMMMILQWRTDIVRSVAREIQQYHLDSIRGTQTQRLPQHDR